MNYSVIQEDNCLFDLGLHTTGLETFYWFIVLQDFKKHMNDTDINFAEQNKGE